MKLWIVRHAIAEDPGPGGDDAARALTPRGRLRFEEAVRGLRRTGARFDLVLHSPLLRAQETAELLAPLCRGRLQVAGELAAPPGEALLELAQGDSVAMVGHEPHVSALVGWLAFGAARAPLFGGVQFKKGAVALLDGEPRPGCMTLRGLWQPGVLRKLAR